MSSSQTFATSGVSDDILRVDKLYATPTSTRASGFPGPAHEHAQAVLEVLWHHFKRHLPFVSHLRFHMRLSGLAQAAVRGTTKIEPNPPSYYQLSNTDLSDLVHGLEMQASARLCLRPLSKGGLHLHYTAASATAPHSLSSSRAIPYSVYKASAARSTFLFGNGRRNMNWYGIGGWASRNRWMGDQPRPFQSSRPSSRRSSSSKKDRRLLFMPRHAAAPAYRHLVYGSPAAAAPDVPRRVRLVYWARRTPAANRGHVCDDTRGYSLPLEAGTRKRVAAHIPEHARSPEEHTTNIAHAVADLAACWGTRAPGYFPRLLLLTRRCALGQHSRVLKDWMGHQLPDSLSIGSDGTGAKAGIWDRDGFPMSDVYGATRVKA
ncbi:hypothetical protein EDB92DRAFT_1950258 [Lactarius akahatsu]|uniref:Uncharacterized protein n=1 Tax=Lactarius akahatsu TaxID=416441 RepID=A0AAD4LA02_9AGAM|nr:hypothetical protein EDB92DRAFT_1950258 [Lactarius akahatsu]